MAEGCPDSGVDIYLNASGVVTVNGRAVPVADLKQMLAALKPTPTEVCYSRANPEGEPPPQEKAVMDAIVGLRLPVGFYTDSTFKARVKLRAWEDSVRPRRLVGASGRPLNFTVRRMTTDRALELIFGLPLVGCCVYALYTGHLWGMYPNTLFNRDEDPWVYWPTVLITLGIGMAFLFGVEDTLFGVKDNFFRWFLSLG
jgi:hypothetical protein